MGEHERTLSVAIAHAVDELAAPVDALVPARLSGGDYILLVQRIESLGRLVDAMRLRVAGDAVSRSGGPIDTFGELGEKTAEDGLAKLTGVSVITAKARIRLGGALTPGLSITGSVTDPAHRHIAAAVAAGHLGVEAAGLLVRELDSVAGRVSAEILDEAERGLVLLAAGTDDHPPLCVDLVRAQATLFIARIDPDGARPKEERVRKRRKLHIGRETADGLIPINGELMAEVGAGLKRLIDAHLRSPAFTDPADPDASFRDHSDDRTIDQKCHHQNIDSGPWRIRMPDGVPHVRGPGHDEWTHVTKSRARPPLPTTG
jgi:hypothetical protein